MADHRALAEQVQRDHVLATRELAALILNELPEGCALPDTELDPAR
jgi:hypothetical protein